MFVNLRVVDGSFLSTLSLRRATVHSVTLSALAPISIHALLAESDGIGLVFLWWGVRFLSTLSLRRATILPHNGRKITKFLSTLSLRRATRVLDGSKSSIEISIHALLAESDGILVFCGPQGSDFYPRSPCGERRR